MAKNNTKPHAVCIPYPNQGHINPLLKLAKILYLRGFYITFINTEFIQNRLLKAGALDSFAKLPDFRLETFPDGLPPKADDDDANQYLYALSLSARKNFVGPVRKLVSKLNSGGDGVPAVTCLISDVLMSFGPTIAKEIGVPGMLLSVPFACSFMGFKYHRHLKERRLIPPKDDELNMVIDSIPGLKNVRLKDIPNFNVSVYDFPMREAELAFNASGIIFITYEAFEQDVFDALKSMFPNIYPIGPLQMLLNTVCLDDEDLKSMSFNLWAEQSDCLKWLDTKQPNSVVYISFGSLVNMTSKQMLEFAWGIFNSNYNFLWILRTDFVKDEPTVLPPEFLEKIKERGLIATWCPQEQVLKHPAVGGFITHFGANSILESIYAQVPMIGWPYYGDHQMNCRFSCKTWGIGLEIENDIRREDVESLVRELMEGEKRKELEKQVVKWKTLAVEATSVGGSSSVYLEKLLSVLLG